MACFLVYSRTGAIQGKEQTAEKAIARAREIARRDGYADVVKQGTRSRRRFYESGRIKTLKRKRTVTA